MRRLPLGLLLAVLAACSDPPADPPAAPWRDVLDAALLEHGAVTLAENGVAALPEAGEAVVREIADLVETATTPGRIGVSARRRLEDWSADERAAALLALLEDRATSPLVRREACAWIEHHGPLAAVPRLILRLKYEKDWVANVWLARALLAHGNGAGLEALENILRTEDAAVEDARFLAAQALALLPEGPGWKRTDAGDFAADFARLLEVRAFWNRERRLSALDPDPADVLTDPGLLAETWRMAGRLSSQALRPVDDARYVLARMRAGVLGPLTELAYDDDLYVREAAMQALGWIGYACGRWARRTGFDWTGWFASALAHPASRMRVLEALGGCGLPQVGPAAIVWVETGAPDTATAAADALLRSARPDAALLERVARRRTTGGLPPEAEYALRWVEHIAADAEGRPDPPAALAADERARRDRWAAERAGLPQAD